MISQPKYLLSRRTVLAGIALIATPRAALANTKTIEVWKTPTCGCCSAWVEHLAQAGFETAVSNLSHDDLDQVKNQLGVPPMLRTFHTAVIDNYVIEGHVPAEDIELLLNARHEIRGIAVPGMPIGSPGMEMGDDTEPYITYAFDENGPVAILAKHGGA